MTDLLIRTEGHAGRITLNRPKALNAMTYDMSLEIERRLDAWATDDRVKLIILDAEGDKAFCAGGDIAELYRTGTAGDYAYGQTFWRDEYRLNAKLAAYPKPIVAFLQGFTMGGGVGLGCHVSHRIVGQSAQISMPECAIGLVPDVGGSYLLARAPGRSGVYLGLTAARMNAADAIHTGFADRFIDEADWPAVKADLVASGDVGMLATCISDTTPDGTISAQAAEIDQLFAGDSLPEILTALRASDSAFAAETLKKLSRPAPLSLAITVALLNQLRDPAASVASALELEYRVTYRIMEHGDFLEGIRAAIIDKDRTPRWRHALDDVPGAEVAAMLAPLGENALQL